MSKIRQSMNIVLSAIIVALGFGSCVSQQKYKAALTEIEELRGQNSALQADKAFLSDENGKLRQELKKVEDYRKRIEERKVVYGPRPTGYKEDINK